jgi:hypothetical protein
MGITGRGRDDEKTKDGTEERKKEQQLYGLNPRKKNIKEDQRKENDNPNLKNKLRQCVTSVDANTSPCQPRGRNSAPDHPTG